MRKKPNLSMGGLLKLVWVTALISLLTVLAAILPLTFLRQTASRKEERPPWRITINMAVDKSLSIPSLSERIEELGKDQHNWRVKVWEGAGSSEIMSSLAEGKTDLAAVVLWDELPGGGQGTKFPSPYFDFALDGLAVVANWRNRVNEVTWSDLIKIIIGEIDNWSQLGGDDVPLVLILAEDDSMMNYPDWLLPAGHPSMAQVRILESSGELVRMVTQEEGALGFIPYSRLGIEVKALMVEGVKPTLRSIVAGNYPLKKRVMIYQAFGLESVVPGLAEVLKREITILPRELEENRVTLYAVGDVMLDRRVGDRIDDFGPNYPFLKVAEILRQADITTGNLESAISSKGRIVDSKLINFRADPVTVAGLSYAGFDVMSLANNHIMNYGGEALIETMELLQREGIEYTGGGRDIRGARTPAILRSRGMRIAFLGYNEIPPNWFRATPSRPGIAWAEIPAVQEDVAKAKGLADLVVVSVHWGVEYNDNEPTDYQRRFGRAAIDSGADVVIGHHPHVLSGFEIYHGGLIAYSLGNFVFDYREFPRPKMSLILSLELAKNGPINLDLIPIHIVDEQPMIAVEEYTYNIPRLGTNETLLSGADIVDQQYSMTADLMEGGIEEIAVGETVESLTFNP